MGQVHQGLYDEKCGGWDTFGMRKGATYVEPLGLEPTHVRWMICHMSEARG